MQLPRANEHVIMPMTFCNISVPCTQRFHLFPSSYGKRAYKHDFNGNNVYEGGDNGSINSVDEGGLQWFNQFSLSWWDGTV